MNDEQLKKANRLQKDMQYLKNNIEAIQDYQQQTDLSSCVIQVSFAKNGLVHNFRTDRGDVSIDETKVCAEMVAVYLLEIYKKRLERLEFEYKNL